MSWRLKPENLAGDYSFSGQFFATHNLMDSVGHAAVIEMYLVVQHYVDVMGTIDYLQVFENTETKQKVYFIDQISDTMKITRQLTAEQLKEMDYCTAMFAEEY